MMLLFCRIEEKRREELASLVPIFVFVSLWKNRRASRLRFFCYRFCFVEWNRREEKLRASILLFCRMEWKRSFGLQFFPFVKWDQMEEQRLTFAFFLVM